MHPHNVWLGVLFAGLCLASGAGGARSGDDDDLIRLRGDWHSFQQFVQGKKMANGSKNGYKIFSKKGKIKVFDEGVAEEEGTLKIDATANPKRMEVRWPDDDGNMVIERFIYKFEGDTLWMCSYANLERRNEFPASFTGKAVYTRILRKK